MLNENLLKILSKNMLTDGFPLIMDLDKSRENIIYDSMTNTEYIDFFTGFASIPISYNHPQMTNQDFIQEIGRYSLVKVTNSDIYTKQFVEAVLAFKNFALPDYLKYIFFIDGGALAVENALKAAFDWKLKKNAGKYSTHPNKLKIIHFNESFHGRSGYTLSLTNTDPIKIAGFPKFNWPRINNPKIKFPIEENFHFVKSEEEKALQKIKMILETNSEEIAAIIIEPIQGEGGDNHFRKEFLQALEKISKTNDVLFIVDEVQTGMCMTGKIWAHQHFDLTPDIVCFGKKTQVCGILAGNRLDEVDDHVFKVSSRINSTWGCNLVDFIRLKQYIKIIQDENLLLNAEIQGKYLLERLYHLQEIFPEMVSNVRGQGLFVALDLPNQEIRDEVLKMLFKNRVIFVGCGKNSIRFRPILDISKKQIDIVMSKWYKVLLDLKKSTPLLLKKVQSN